LNPTAQNPRPSAGSAGDAPKANLIAQSTPATSGVNGPRRRDWFPPSRFLIALVVLIVASPFLDLLQNGRIVEAIMLIAVFAAAMLVVSDRRQVLMATLFAMVPAVIGVWLNGLTLRTDHPSFLAASGLVFVGFAIVKLVGNVLRAREVNAEILSAAVAAYLCLGILWSFGYTLIAQAVPGSFHYLPGSGAVETMRGFNSLYFSFCTLTTIGVGEVIPNSGAAKILVMTEATCGMFYMATLIARLVAIYPSRRAADGAVPSEDRFTT
jgi:hypothetical protein